MRKKILISLISLLGSALLFAQTKGKREDFGPARLGNILYCLQTKATSFGFAPPRFSSHAFLVRYVYGKEFPGDEDDELHMVVYGPREKSATLFEVYLHGVDNNKPEIFIGDAATLRMEHGRLVVDELPGGQGTLRRIEKLLTVISRRPAVIVKDNQVKPGPAPCVYEP
jgi:hypothetical protein